ncbi:hypothetical protein KIPB_006750, partial [Kipferlia bialata]
DLILEDRLERCAADMEADGESAKRGKSAHRHGHRSRRSASAAPQRPVSVSMSNNDSGHGSLRERQPGGEEERRERKRGEERSGKDRKHKREKREKRLRREARREDSGSKSSKSSRSSRSSHRSKSRDDAGPGLGQSGVPRGGDDAPLLGRIGTSPSVLRLEDPTHGANTVSPGGQSLFARSVDTGRTATVRGTAVGERGVHSSPMGRERGRQPQGTQGRDRAPAPVSLGGGAPMSLGPLEDIGVGMGGDTDSESDGGYGAPGYSDGRGASLPSGKGTLSTLHVRGAKPLSQSQTRSLRQVLFGGDRCKRDPSIDFPPSWYQSLSLALAGGEGEGEGCWVSQSEGGPCGPLSVVQARILRFLHFEPPLSPYASLPPLRAAVLSAVHSCLTVSAPSPSARRPVHLVLPQDLTPGTQLPVLSRPDTYVVSSADSASHLAHTLTSPGVYEWISASGACSFVPCLVVSLCLTRGLPPLRDSVLSDMDSDGDACLLSPSHDNCNQELVSLMLTGRACSNVFEGDRDMGGGMVLRGVPSRARCDVGFLSIFEAHGYHTIAPSLKHRVSCPVWVCFNEAHYTVLLADPSPSHSGMGPSLYGKGVLGCVSRPSHACLSMLYYDQLGGDDVYRLSVPCTPDPASPGPVSGPVDTTDLESYVDMLIRTLVPGQDEVDWDGEEPLL